VTLSWDANREPEVAGYIVYYGDASGHYTNSFDVGKVTTTVASNLVTGAAYFFVVTAYSTSKLESAPSNEVSCRVPFLPNGTNSLPSKVKGFVSSR
jgi:hypothetical protein